MKGCPLDGIYEGYPSSRTTSTGRRRRYWAWNTGTEHRFCGENVRIDRMLSGNTEEKGIQAGFSQIIR
jgi:hypothetical protein